LKCAAFSLKKKLKKYLLQFIEIIANTEYPQNIYLLIYKNVYINKKNNKI